MNDDLKDNIGVEKNVTGNLQSFHSRLQALRPVHIEYRRGDATEARLHEPHSQRQCK